MKTRTVIILIAVAAVITFGQWAVVMGGDAFTLHSPTNYKVFTYGFPFRIVECAPVLPIRTPLADSLSPRREFCRIPGSRVIYHLAWSPCSREISRS